MKRKSMQEILEATKPEEIFTMDLEIIQQEKEEYLNKYKPEKYQTIQNKLVTRKITKLYNQAVSILEENESFQENYTNINYNTNYKLAEEILDSSQKILNEIVNITDMDDRNNISEEYYMLQREIMEFEDKLIEMNAIKKAYEKMCLEKQDEIEMTDNDIRLIFTFFKDQENLEMLKNAVRLKKINPISYIVEKICEGGLRITRGDHKGNYDFIYRRISIRIAYTNIWLISNVELGKGIIDIPNRKFIEDKFILEIDRYKFLCSYKKNDNLVTWIEREVAQDSIKRREENRNYLINKYKRYEDYTEYLNSEFGDSELRVEKIDKKLAEALIQVAWKLLEEKHPIVDTYEEYEVDKFKCFLTSINMDIKMNNLRNLHSELRNAVRRCKLII